MGVGTGNKVRGAPRVDVDAPKWLSNPWWAVPEHCPRRLGRAARCGFARHFPHALPPPHPDSSTHREGGTAMDFRPLNMVERKQLLNALRGNAEQDYAILLDRRDTSFAAAA